MSLKKIYILAIGLFSVGCFAQNNPFEHLSLEERNQMAEKYHKLSMEKYQTSEMHRIYKDSALMANPNHIEYTERYSYSYRFILYESEEKQSRKLTSRYGRRNRSSKRNNRRNCVKKRRSEMLRLFLF